MFPLKIVLVLLLFTCQRPPSELHLPTTAQIIYGKDYRQEPHHVPSLWRDKSRSVAAQIHNYYLTPKGDFYQLSSKNYWKTQSYCQDEKFYGQPLLARCSGFLIASDLIITAGHCHSGCPYYVWVFDYNINSDISSIPRQNVYNCKSSILFHPSGQFNEGFSLIHLNRPVPPHRKPLPPAHKRPYKRQRSSDTHGTSHGTSPQDRFRNEPPWKCSQRKYSPPLLSCQLRQLRRKLRLPCPQRPKWTGRGYRRRWRRGFCIRP